MLTRLHEHGGALVVLIVSLLCEAVMSVSLGANPQRTILVLVIAVVVSLILERWASQRRNNGKIMEWATLTDSGTFQTLTRTVRQELLLNPLSMESIDVEQHYADRVLRSSNQNTTLSDSDIPTRIGRNLKVLPIVGPPRSGKSSLLKHILSRIPSSAILLFPKSRHISTPPSGLVEKLEGKDVVIVVDDLDLGNRNSVDLGELMQNLGAYCASCSLIFTTRPDQSLTRVLDVNPTLGNSLGPNGPMHLVPLSSVQKRKLTESLGRVWEPFDESRHSLPSEIVNPREYQHASARFEQLDDETKDVLRALKLLDILWMPSPTRAMVEEALRVIRGTSSFNEVRESQVSSALNQGFVRSWGNGEIHPEFAYIRRDDVVSYRQDRIGLDDAKVLLAQLVVKFPSQVNPRTLFVASKLWGQEVSLQYCEDWISAGADRTDGIAAKASLLFQLGRTQEALDSSKELSQDAQFMFELQYLEEQGDHHGVIEKIETHFDRIGFNWRLISRTRYPKEMLIDAEYLFNLPETIGISDEGQILTLKLANALNSSERFEDALEVWNSVLAAYPDHRIALSGKARSLHFIGDTDRAIKAIWEATRHWPEDAQLWHFAAQLASEAGRFVLAATAISNALKFAPRELSYLLTDLDVTGKIGTPQQYLAKALAIIEIDPENDAVKLEIARKMHALRREEEAIEILRPLVANGYNLKESTEILADALLSLNYEQQALDIMQKHPDVHNSVVAISIMGEAFSSLKRYEDAAYWCLLAAQKHDDPELAAHFWKLTAFALVNGNKVEECRSIFDSRPIDLDDFDVRRLKVLISPSHRLDDDTYREVCELLVQEPNDFQLLQARAFHHIMMGQYGLATVDFESMHRLRPENESVLANLQKCRQINSKDENCGLPEKANRESVK